MPLPSVPPSGQRSLGSSPLETQLEVFIWVSQATLVVTLWPGRKLSAQMIFPAPWHALGRLSSEAEAFFPSKGGRLLSGTIERKDDLGLKW